MQADLRPTKCYLSTPEHCRSFYGRYVYIYTDSGSLELENSQLRFVGRRTTLDIQIDSITELAIGTFSRGAKPTALNRIELTYSAHNEEPDKTVGLIPTRTGFVPTWTTNGIGVDWQERIASGRL